jgi:hypothetical protein
MSGLGRGRVFKEAWREKRQSPEVLRIGLGRREKRETMGVS